MFSKKLTFLILAGFLALPVLAQAQPTDPAYPVFTFVERTALTADVAEYYYQGRTGPGTYDVIGVHRVVKESAPNVPVVAPQAVFLAHGDIWNFRAAFLTPVSSAAPADQSFPVFLAENGIDVWGIDFGWTLVPPTETDFSFMETWGIEREAKDLGTAIGFARATRFATGSGRGRIDLMGWSRGGQIGYVYLNSEAVLPLRLRQVKGYIPADIYLKTDNQDFRLLACKRWRAAETAIESGQFADPTGTLVAPVGALAILDPNGPSFLNAPNPPFFLDNYTNREAALLLGAGLYRLQGGVEPVPFYHLTGGTFDTNDKPTSLRYTDEQDLFKSESAASPFQPNRIKADADAATCEVASVPYDDHLGQITVPVLYVGAGGGFGTSGIYTTTLLGSTDVTALLMSAPLPQTPRARLFDYGHSDLFLSADAKALVWQPVLSWIKTH